MHAIKDYYSKVCEHAELLCQQLEHPVPIIATGHLFVTGGKTLKDDGVRELYVGSLAQFGTTDFFRLILIICIRAFTCSTDYCWIE